MAMLAKVRLLECLSVGVAAAILPVQAAAASLLSNGDFESGSLPPWTIIYPLGPDAAQPPHQPTDVINTSSQTVDAHAGLYGVAIRNPGWTTSSGGIIGIVGMIAQNVDTVPGQAYALSYWMKILDSAGTADLGVAGWGDADAGCDWTAIIPGNVSGVPCGVVSGSWTLDPAGRDWVQYSFPVTATGNRSTLVLAGRSDFSRVSFDDVTLTPIPAVPEPSSLLLMATAVAVLAARRSRTRQLAGPAVVG